MPRSVESWSTRRSGGLFELSQGNALFLRELVLAAFETDKLRDDEGVWRWSGTFRPSTRLSAILDDRLGRL